MKPGDKAVSYADDEAYYVFALDTDDADIIVAIDGTTAFKKIGDPADTLGGSHDGRRRLAHRNPMVGVCGECSL